MSPFKHIHMTEEEFEQIQEDILEVFGKSPAYHRAVQWEMDQRFGEIEGHLTGAHAEEIQCVCGLLVMNRILTSIVK